MADTPVKVPKELLGVSATALEEYVRSRLLQFIKRFGVSLAQQLPGVTAAVLDRAVHDTVRALPLPDYGQVPLERRQLQLVFRHDCQALGCLEAQCPLCQHNSKRRCTVNFCKKYLVNDRMLARCGAQIRIEVIDRATGRLCDSDLSDIFLEVFILNGASYDQHFLDATRTSSLSRADSSNPDSVAALNRDLDDCALLANNKGKPLLASLAAGQSTADGKLLIQAVHGRVVLQDLAVTDSSEAMLSGRKPPFRLVVRAKRKGGQHLTIRPAVSEAFVVATRRVKTSHKADIPTVDDPVAKLMHMGKETCRKLADLHTAAQQANMELDLEPQLACVDKVVDFKALAARADADSQLRSQLQTLLKLPKDKWEECVAHAKCAVFPDNRPRAWFADRGNTGLLFSATLGVVDLKRPEALLQRVVEPNGSSRLQIVAQQQQTPAQRDVVRQLLPQAEECWWSPGHVGWTLFDLDAMAPTAMQPSPAPAVLTPMSPLAPSNMPLSALAPSPAGKGLIVASPAAPIAAAGIPMSLGGVPTQLLQHYAAANAMAAQQAAASAAAGAMQPLQQQQQQAAAAVPAVSSLPPVPELSLGLSSQQQSAGMLGGTAAAAAMPAPGTLQHIPSSSSFQSPSWMQGSAGNLPPTPAAQQQCMQPPQPVGTQQGFSASAAQQQQQQQAATPMRQPPSPTASAGGVGGGNSSGAQVSTTPRTPAIPSAFAALATQPITASEGQETTPPPQAAQQQQPGPAGPSLSAAAAARGLEPSGGNSSGLGSSLQQSRSLSWLPPLSGRRRSYMTLSDRSPPGSRAAGSAAAAPAGPPSHTAPTSQLSADVEHLLNSAGFNPSLPGPMRDAPSLTAFPSMSLFVDTVSPAAAAGGGTGAALLGSQYPSSSGRPSSAPHRAASAGLSGLMSLDLASLLRGTSMLPNHPVSAPPAPAAVSGAHARGGGGGGAGGGDGGHHGGGGGEVFGGTSELQLRYMAGTKVDDDGLPTPHAAAAAEAMMALSDPMLGSLPDIGAGSAAAAGADQQAGGGGDDAGRGPNSAG